MGGIINFIDFHDKIVNTYNKCNDGIIGLKTVGSIRDKIEESNLISKKTILFFIEPAIKECLNNYHDRSLPTKKLSDEILSLIFLFFPYGKDGLDTLKKELKLIPELDVEVYKSESNVHQRKKCRTYSDLILYRILLVKQEVLLYKKTRHQLNTLENIIIPQIINNNYPTQLNSIIHKNFDSNNSLSPQEKRRKAVAKLFNSLSNNVKFQKHGKPAYQLIDIEIAKKLNSGTETIRKDRRVLGLTSNNHK